MFGASHSKIPISQIAKERKVRAELESDAAVL